jgi:hypothetical protein
MTDTTVSLGRPLPADRFHAGVRLAALVLWLLAIVVVYFILAATVGLILGQVGGLGVVILLIAAVILAQPLAYLAEKQLIARWPSGRAVVLEPGAITWRDKGKNLRLEMEPRLNFWRWRFTVRRRRGGRVPTGHNCFAIRMVQGDSVISLYTFLAPAAATALLARMPFYELRRPSEQGKAGPALGGRDAMYLAAEHARWDTGAELDAADFEALLAHLGSGISEFSRSTQSGG